MVSIERCSPAFACRVTGIDLSKPVTESDAKALRAAAADYAVMVFPGQPHEAAQQNLGAVFGEGFAGSDITNMDEAGNIRPVDDKMTKQIRANETWHVDMLAYPEPSRVCMLRAKELPSSPGGETQFADLSALWPKLSRQRRNALLGKQAEHTFEAIGRRTGSDYPLDLVAGYQPTQHPAVTTEPASKLPVILIGSHTARIIGSDEDVDDLITLATEPGNVFTHRWSLGDLLLWNNRRVMHRVTPYANLQEKRRLARYDVKGGPPSAYSPGLLSRMFA